MKKNWKTAILGIGSVAFGFLAVFLGGKLYLTRNVSISPSAPQSKPGATNNNTCQGFSVTFPSPVSTTTPEASPTEAPLSEILVSEPSPTPQPLSCYSMCTASSECEIGMQCVQISGEGRCVNPACSESENCTCTLALAATPTPTITTFETETPTPTSISTPTPTSISATPTPIASTSTTSTQIACGGACIVGNANCTSGMECLLVNGTYQCANPSCSTESDCICSLANAAVPSPVANQLPHAGIGIPTAIILSFASVLILGSLLLI